MANGYLNKPKLPGIPGIAAFRGRTFHTSRWDYGYTGDDLENLADKRVGIIGTGATAIQCVPRLARDRQSGCCLQIPLGMEPPTDPGSGSRTVRRLSVSGSRTSSCSPVAEAAEDLVNDAWTSITKRKVPVMRQHATDDLTPEELAKRSNSRTTPRWRRSGRESMRS